MSLSGLAPSDESVRAAPADGRRVLVAGIGNIFFGDDGFGVEVARRLASRAFSEHVKVADFGIRGIHLAYELLDGGYDTTVLVDATPRGETPGTVYLIEPTLGADDLGAAAPSAADAHSMSPGAVFTLLSSLGGVPGRVLIVGCEPGNTEEGIGLSDAVAAAVDAAVTLIIDVVARETGPRDRSFHLRAGSELS